MRIDTKQRKKATPGSDKAKRTLFMVISHGEKALDNVFIDTGRMLAESSMQMEQEELAEPDDLTPTSRTPKR